MTPWRAAAIGFAAAATIASTPLTGQAPFPNHPVKLIVPFPAGAGTDTIARMVAQKLGNDLGQPVVVENRTGAGGAIGAAEVAHAAPDGYTLLFVASPFSTAPVVMKDAGYDPIEQFAPVVAIASGPLAFVVNLAVPATTLREFIEVARRNPGKLNYGSAGMGSVNHLALVLFDLRAGVDMAHVPYRGIADATKDLLAGQIQAMTASIPATLPLLAAGKLKVLAVTGPKRVAQMPEVPTWGEQGVRDAEVINYWGIVAPRGTPPAVVERLNRSVGGLLAQPAVRDRLEREGVEVLGGPPGELSNLVAADYYRWKKVVADARITFE
jgi:tripartite-type tricarboxylate transporter receptor subunit TctC